MSAFVNLEILGAGDHRAAAEVRTREGLLARVHAYVVDELVLGLEGAQLARASLPVARVQLLRRRAVRARQARDALRSADVLHTQVGHYVVHGVEDARAALAALRIDPLARVLALHAVVCVARCLLAIVGAGGALLAIIVLVLLFGLEVVVVLVALHTSNRLVTNRARDVAIVAGSQVA